MSEFKKLSDEQKEELFQWRKNRPDKKTGKYNNFKSKPKDNEVKTDVSSIMSQQLDKKLAEMSKKREEEDKTDQEAKAYIISLFTETELKSENKTVASTSTSATSNKTVRKIDLKSILKRAKNAWDGEERRQTWDPGEALWSNVSSATPLLNDYLHNFLSYVAGVD